MSVAAKVNIVLLLLERSLDVLSAVRGGGADLENPEWRRVCVMAGGGVTPSVCPLSVLISHQPEVSAVNTSHILDLRNQIRPVTTSPSPSCPTIHCGSTSSWSHGAVGCWEITWRFYLQQVQVYSEDVGRLGWFPRSVRTRRGSLGGSP